MHLIHPPWLGAVLVALCAVLAAPCTAQSTAPPNILFILSDDQAPDTIGAWGYPNILTPNLDRLAADGVNFMHTYHAGSWSPAVCVPSRTMLLSGLTVWRAQAMDNQQAIERGQWWPQIMRQAGYETYMTGKWHLNPGPEHVFDHIGQVRGGMPATVPEAYNRPLPDEKDPWDPADPSIGGFWAGGRHWSQVVADDAVMFFKRAAERDKPFFMYVAFNAPHDPRQSPQEFLDKYPADAIELPDNFLPSYPFADAMGAPHRLRDEHLAPMPRTAQAVQVHRREYYAMISHMDQQIGRILDALQQSGKADNTYIIFTSDHGLGVGRHGLFGKQNMYEHSLRVPCIIVGPGMTAGRRITHRVYLHDLVPTVIELAGLPVPEHIEFRSLLPLIRGDINEHHRDIYGAYRDLQRMVIQDDWKLIVYPGVPRLRLYHLADDPLEMNDLAEQPEHRPRMAALLAALLQLQRELDDPMDLSATIQPWLD